MKTKQRIHNEWFRTVLCGGRKSCPSCGCKLEGRSIWSWGEYVRAKWRTVDYFCEDCYKDRVQHRLLAHAATCGCEIALVGYHTELPAWLTLTPTQQGCAV